MSLDKAIDHYIDLVEGHSSFPPSLAAEAAALRDRLSTGQLHLAVLGQFKRGKSTLINALLGAKILAENGPGTRDERSGPLKPITRGSASGRMRSLLRG